MKKIILLLILVFSSFSYSFDLKIKSELPLDVEKEIRSAVSSHSSSERREYFNWYKEAYLKIEKRLDDANIPEEDREYITKKLKVMYGSNYPKQLTVINSEIAEYQNLVNRIREEQVEIVQKQKEEEAKSKKEIEEILDTQMLPESFKDNVRLNAKTEFPDNSSLQKAYIKGAIQTYLELNKLIKK